VAKGMRNLENGGVSDVCVKAKQSREGLPHSPSQAFSPLELVHTAFMGLMRTRGFEGLKCVVTLEIEFSRDSEVL
jgi:hypothetical protein